MATRVRDYDELYPGRFLKAGAFKGETPTYTIEDVNVEELHGDKGKEMKATVVFSDAKQGWVMCKTNGLCLKGMFGRSLDDWIGKRVTLFAEDFEGEPAIRVWGSPDITEDIKVLIAFPRKKPYTRTMRPTGKASTPTRKTQVSEAPKERTPVPQNLQKYVDKISAAQFVASLVEVEDMLAEDSTLDAADTARVMRWMDAKRQRLDGPG